ncbi:MAG: hypothetical protein SF339_17470 [Blastocatellia bacterium]|nr:hypothetical protein [Blastocatellia bacterium]
MAHRIQSMVLVLILIALPAASGCDALLRALDPVDESMACCAMAGGCDASMAAIEPGGDGAMSCLCDAPSMPVPAQPAGQTASSTLAALAPDEAPAEDPFRAAPAIPNGVPRPAYSPPRNHTYLLNSTFRI